jgi:hypothetical protein
LGGKEKKGNCCVGHVPYPTILRTLSSVSDRLFPTMIDSPVQHDFASLGFHIELRISITSAPSIRPG